MPSGVKVQVLSSAPKIEPTFMVGFVFGMRFLSLHPGREGEKRQWRFEGDVPMTINRQ